MATEATSTDAGSEPDNTLGPGKGNRKRCPVCKRNFASKHPLGICKRCGGGGNICLLEMCNEPVEWRGYVPEIVGKGIPAKPGVPCRYCYAHMHRTAPSTFRDGFETDFNEQRHGWRQDVAEGEKFPIEEGGY